MPYAFAHATSSTKNQTVVTDNTALAVAAAALSSGQSATFASGANPYLFLNDLEWQTNFVYDPIHKLAHAVGKPVGDTAWQPTHYDQATNTWSTDGTMWNNLGHVYGNFNIDPATGNLYVARGGFFGGGDHSKQVARWDRSTATWGYAPTAGNVSAATLDDIGNGLAYHPNLYGTGDGGFCMDLQHRTILWRESNDTPDDTNTHDESLYGAVEGAACYVSGLDAVFLGGSTNGSTSTPQALLKITQGPTLTQMPAPPVDCGGHSRESAGHTFGSLHQHPTNANALIIVETNGTHWHQSTDGANTWSDMGTHPFNNATQFPRILSSIPAYGVIWALFCPSDGNNSQASSILWKP